MYGPTRREISIIQYKIYEFYSNFPILTEPDTDRYKTYVLYIAESNQNYLLFLSRAIKDYSPWAQI